VRPGRIFVLICLAALVSGAASRSWGRLSAESLAPRTGGDLQEPAKVNPRPAESSSPEPYDSATVEEMAKACVDLQTDAGLIRIEMLAESAPETARNFLNLAAIHAFDTTAFSRIVKGFVIQGGNLSTGEKWTLEMSRRAARTIPDEPNPIKHVRGIVSMARPDTPNGATTHFFVLVNQAPQLDGTFAAFGRVLEGMDVVEGINQAPAEGEKPLKPVHIIKATVQKCAK
jgi:peptidyl-prolyl cis-trans isomerase B (cyclophilin B)